MNNAESAGEELLVSDEEENKRTPPTLPKASIYLQLIAAIAASIGTLACGTVMGWSGSTLTKLSSDFEMGQTPDSLVASAISFGSLIGSVISGKATDNFGRRKVLLVVTPIAISGWVAMGSATHLYILYFGRFLCGFSSGFIFPVSQIYISETCQGELRGRFGSLPSLCVSIGILLSYTIGALTPWRFSCYIFTVPYVVMFISMYIVPESPYWFMLKKEYEQAHQSLVKLRGKGYPVDIELKGIAQSILSVGENVSYTELLHPRTRVPFLITIFLHTLQQVCGVAVLMVYMSGIYKNADSSINIYFATIYTGVAQVIGTIFSIIFIDKIGRRILVIISLSLVSGFYFLLGAYFYVQGGSNPWPAWCPLFMLIGIVFCYCLGTRNVPWVISSEIFNTSIRAKANAVDVVYNRLLNFLLIQMYPFFINFTSYSTVFFSYGALSLVCDLVAFRFVPETKGKSLQEIQEYFERNMQK